ncbi:MAG: hypothetical protein HY295_03290 [Thaumarchaeota archaeon]|nr:hypothetical protein [Nitrososphaerota archaeon]
MASQSLTDLSAEITRRLRGGMDRTTARQSAERWVQDRRLLFLVPWVLGMIFSAIGFLVKPLAEP